METVKLLDNFIVNLTNRLEMAYTRNDSENHIMINFQSLSSTIVLYLAPQKHRLSVTNKRVFHIDIDQVESSGHKIIQRLCSLLGKGTIVYARETVVARIDKKTALEFQKEHHLQFDLPGKYRYGLYHHGELVSVAIFSGGRHMNDKPADYRSFELIRFCHKSGYRVVGGLSKLIKAFRKDFQPNDIMTYVDCDWSQDSNLSTLGFVEKGKTIPQTYWIEGSIRHHISNNESLHKLQSTYPQGYLKYNSGSTKLIMTL